MNVLHHNWKARYHRGVTRGVSHITVRYRGTRRTSTCTENLLKNSGGRSKSMAGERLYFEKDYAVR